MGFVGVPTAVICPFTNKPVYWLKITLKRFNILSLILLTFITVLVICSTYIYQLWVGDKSDIPFYLTIGVAAFAAIYVIGAPYSIFVNGFGKLKLTTYISFFNIVAFYVAAIVLSDIIGNSLSIAISLCITNIIGLAIRYFQTKKILDGTAYGIWFK